MRKLERNKLLEHISSCEMSFGNLTVVEYMEVDETRQIVHLLILSVIKHQKPTSGAATTTNIIPVSPSLHVV